ncbi:hypothetical protein A2625_02195 [candidate division WOR-1 bacterium RIFCSPHIGHO2_01_FULL_53_15]|uniref:Uncharacterized protein n=1 Tax=candidate division WOR-1 bacterium RIFCSPHIGHO2_01_FULL_53_15 TaxID=1802564 RepID=A0A1F4PYU2_UNCSA|nr:MAG: hypothetical protein A2625_02195 [candidate division WOR-1 bacterium RIFCSPHIGHO2_01_FULL_53_15]OGC10714.1 MAG: hypothetical protein A3D23_00885 [candidate division WOR-1 bacterium RIFCSPHIGHO2_02_FULL_53_26]
MITAKLRLPAGRQAFFVGTTFSPHPLTLKLSPFSQREKGKAFLYFTLSLLVRRSPKDEGGWERGGRLVSAGEGRISYVIINL